MLEYSTVGMITAFWLAVRAAGFGVGWPEEEHLDPELERFGGQMRDEVARQVRIV